MGKTSVEKGRASAPAGKRGRPRSSDKPAARGVRRPQAERSADTRNRVIEAAIICLAKIGYGATTVTVVADAAKVSRGGMTHQFPSKSDLMLAVVEAVYEKDAGQYRSAAAELSPHQFIQSLPATMWDVISQPSGIAVMEIMMASRSDRDLADKLRTVQRALDVRAHQWIIERLESAGLHDRPDGEALHRLSVAAVRGLVMEGLFRRDRAGIERSVEILKDIMSLLYPTTDARS